MKHSEPLILNKEEFFEGFDNPSLQEKVVGIKIALLQNDNGEIGLGLGIEAPPLHSSEIEEINRFFCEKYNVDEMIQKLLQHYRDQRSQNADSKANQIGSMRLPISLTRNTHGCTASGRYRTFGKMSIKATLAALSKANGISVRKEAAGFSMRPSQGRRTL